MALQPAIQNDRHTGQRITWYYDDGRTPKPITGAVITGTITGDATRAIDGTLTVIDGTAGIFQWAYGAGDTGVVGRFTVQFTATYPDTYPDTSFDMGWEVMVKR